MKSQNTSNKRLINGEFMNPFIKCYQQKLVQNKLKLKGHLN